MWTGNYNFLSDSFTLRLTLAGSMWTGNYNVTDC